MLSRMLCSMQRGAIFTTFHDKAYEVGMIFRDKTSGYTVRQLSGTEYIRQKTDSETNLGNTTNLQHMNIAQMIFESTLS